MVTTNEIKHFSFFQEVGWKEVFTHKSKDFVFIQDHEDPDKSEYILVLSKEDMQNKNLKETDEFLKQQYETKKKEKEESIQRIAEIKALQEQLAKAA